MENFAFDRPVAMVKASALGFRLFLNHPALREVLAIFLQSVRYNLQGIV